jgi:hypothetical protein
VLNGDQRGIGVFLATAHLLRLRNEGHAFLDRILTANKSRILDPRLQRQNAEWRAQTSPRKKISRLSRDAVKFFRRNGLVLAHHVPIGATVSGQNYCALLHVGNKIFGVNDLNRKTISTLLSLILYIA